MVHKETERQIGPGDTVLVTGAAGGIARHVIRALLDAECHVRAVDRVGYDDAPAIDSLVERSEVEWITGDLFELDLDELTHDASAVIHLAADARMAQEYADLVENNVDLVELIYEAAVRNQVKHMVHFGSGGIYQPSRGPLEESAQIELSNPYEETKYESEVRLFEAVVESTPVTVLRPALAYGPHTTSMAAGLVTIPPVLRNFLPYLPGFTGGARANWAHVADIAAAAMVVLGNPRAYGEVFNVADATPVGAGEVLTAMTEAYGLPIGPLIRFPNSTVIMTFSPVIDRGYVEATLRTVLRQVWARTMRKRGIENSPLRPRVDRAALLYVADDTILDSGRLQALGWEADHLSFVESIGETLSWYQEHGWVPRYDTDATQTRYDQASVGFAIDQELKGTWTDDEGDSRELEIQIGSEFQNVARGDFTGHINGNATFEGWVEDVELEGTVEVKLFGSQTVRYQFGFVVDGEPFRCQAEASFTLFRPFNSMSALRGTLFNKVGDEIGEIELDFAWADQSVPVLMSFRPITA